MCATTIAHTDSKMECRGTCNTIFAAAERDIVGGQRWRRKRQGYATEHMHMATAWGEGRKAAKVQEMQNCTL